MASTNEELASALKMFSRFFDLIHQPLAVINERGEYVYYNQESADLDGYSIEQAMGKHMLDVYPSMKENQSTMLSSLKDGVEYIGHYQIYYNARGQAVDYQHTTAPLYSSKGNMVGVIEIGRNMSGVRRLQEQVVELNHLLYAQGHEKHHAIITENAEMLANIAKAKRLAVSNIPVTIDGETGTGKELFSRLIHQCSKRFTILAVAEGAISKEDALLSKKDYKKKLEDRAKKYPSVSYEIADKITQELGSEVRITVPGHTQRGGAPCAYDRVLSTRIGAGAAEAILDGEYGIMIGVVNGKIKRVPLEECAGKLKMVSPKDQTVKAAKQIGISFGD